MTPSYSYENVNDLHSIHGNKTKEKNRNDKLDKKIQDSKKRVKIKWFQNDNNKREKQQQEQQQQQQYQQIAQRYKSENVCRNFSVKDNGENKYVNQCIGERRTNVLDVAASLTCATLESGCVIPAPRSNDRFATKINNNYNFKYYGFLDSGDENTNDVIDEREPYRLNANVPIDLIPIKNDNLDNRFAADDDTTPIKTFKAEKLTDMASGKRMVITKDYGLQDYFSYLDTYSVGGIPGNWNQSSAAAAFFAR